MRKPIVHEILAKVRRAVQPLHPSAARKQEKRPSGGSDEGITLLGILLKSRARRVRDGHEAGFSELGLANREDAVFQIHVGSAERQCFPWAEARGGEQANKCCISQSS